MWRLIGWEAGAAAPVGCRTQDELPQMWSGNNPFSSCENNARHCFLEIVNW